MKILVFSQRPDEVRPFEHFCREHGVDLRPVNRKLILRSVRLIRKVTGCSTEQAEAAFVASGKNPKTAIVMVLLGTGKVQAEALLLLPGYGPPDHRRLQSERMETENTLRKSADLALPVPSLERIYRTGAAVSRINQLAVIDMIYTLPVSGDLDRSIRAMEETMAATHEGREPAGQSLSCGASGQPRPYSS